MDTPHINVTLLHECGVKLRYEPFVQWNGQLLETQTPFFIESHERGALLGGRDIHEALEVYYKEVRAAQIIDFGRP